MFQKISHHCSGAGLLLLRLALGIIFIAHGYQKFNEFGAEGFALFLMSLGVPMPLFFAWIVIIVEFVGGILLILGALTRLAGILIAINMMVAIFLAHIPNGIFVSNNGYEFALILFAAALSLVFTGPGCFAIDSWCEKRKKEGSHVFNNSSLQGE